jgi:cyclase
MAGYALKLIAAVMATISSLSVFAQAPIVRELSPGVFFYFGDEAQKKSANCVWVVFNDYVLAIDANYPWGAEEILKEIRKTTDKPVRFVFNTHYHHDHTFGNIIFRDSGAAVVSTNKTAQEMATLGQYEWDHGSDYSGRNMAGYKRSFPTITFNDTLVFDDGTHRVELIKMGPAHTGGDGVAYLPKEKILVTGDLFVNGNPWGNNVADANANYDRWLDVLKRMSQWKVVTVIPGHGDPGTTESLLNQRAYLADMLKQVRQGIKAGKSKQELIEEIDLSRHPVYGANVISTKRSVANMYDQLKPKVKR